MLKFKVLGITDEGVCGCCGKTNLKRTVAMETESGDVVHYGTDCASKAMRQHYQGRAYPISRDAVKSMAYRASRGESVTIYSRA